MRTILSTTFISELCGVIIAPLVSMLLFTTQMLFLHRTSGLWLGVSGGLYYSIFIALFFGLLPGMLIGLTTGLSRIIVQCNQQARQLRATTRTKSIFYSYRDIYTVIAGVLIGIILSIISIAYLFTFQIGVERQITHQMQWFVGQQGCFNHQQAVYFVYADNPRKSEYICSDELAATLQRGIPSVLSVHFVVTYDFGRVRGYNFESIKSLPPELLQGAGGSATGCVDPVLPACDLTVPE